MSRNIVYQHRDLDISTWGTTDPQKHVLDYRTPHVHREMELIFYTGGKTVAYADSTRYELQAGDVFLTFPNQIHSYETHAPETFRLFQIKPELIPELLDVLEMAIPQSAVIPGAANDLRLQSIVSLLTETIESSPTLPYRNQKLHGYLLALFSELLSKMQLDTTHLTDSNALRSIVSYCSRNYDKELSLSVLEESLHLNRYYISHLFSGKLGLRFNDYVNSLRVSEACRRLLHTDESITDISTDVGFNTLRTFNRAFIKQTGMTPSEYRRQAQTDHRDPTAQGTLKKRSQA